MNKAYEKARGGRPEEVYKSNLKRGWKNEDLFLSWFESKYPQVNIKRVGHDKDREFKTKLEKTNCADFKIYTGKSEAGYDFDYKCYKFNLDKMEVRFKLDDVKKCIRDQCAIILQHSINKNVILVIPYGYLNPNLPVFKDPSMDNKDCVIHKLVEGEYRTFKDMMNDILTYYKG